MGRTSSSQRRRGRGARQAPTTARSIQPPSSNVCETIVDHSIKTILVVLADTATGVRNDIAAIRGAIDAAGHPALLMVDAIASLGCDRYEMDEWGVDVTVERQPEGSDDTARARTSSGRTQKALAAHERADMRVGYLDWTSRRNVDAHYQLYNGTPPISAALRVT